MTTLIDNTTTATQTEQPTNGQDPVSATRKRSAAKDRPPKKRARTSSASAAGTAARKTETRAAESKRIEETLSLLLSTPGIPFGMLGVQYLDQHFSTAGPEFARTIVKASEHDPRLREWLVRLTSMSGTSATLIVGALAYLAPPVLYLLTPDDFPARAMFGVPPRPNAGSATPPTVRPFPYADATQGTGHTAAPAAPVAPVADSQRA